MKHLRHASLSSTGLVSIAALFLMCPAQAHAACSEWVMPAKTLIQQSNETLILAQFTAGEDGFSGKATNQYWSERMETVGTVDGVLEGAVQGSNVQFTIHWGQDIFRKVPNATGIYTGTVGPQGRVTGTSYDQVNPESTATWYFKEVLLCRSAATAPSYPTLGFGRVKPLPGSAPAPVRSICEMARSARARGSPAAPGLERQCAAQTPPASVAFGRINVQTPPSAPAGVGFGRVNVQTPPAGVGFGRVKVDGNADTRSICEMAANARARNSPAAPGLERQCAQSPAAEAAANAGSPAQAEMEGTPGDVRLSRVYTGGGSNGASSDDFVELRNRGQTPLDLSGWSLQYASPQGSFWQVIPLSGTIEPDRIFLISSGRMQFGSAVVPPDWAAPIQLGANAGKLALVRSTSPLDGACPVDSAAMVDFLGYGTANCSLENVVSAGPANAAFIRLQDGCTDTRDNGTDFTVGPATALDRVVSKISRTSSASMPRCPSRRTGARTMCGWLCAVAHRCHM